MSASGDLRRAGSARSLGVVARVLFVAVAIATVVALPTRAQAQQTDPSLLADVWYASRAAEAILSSSGAVSLEAFDGPAITGVYLHGTLNGEKESVAYGVDGEGKRYSWFSVAHGDSVEYVAMLFDVDLDLTPDFLLFRTIDRRAREEAIREYRTPEIMDDDIDIQVNSACAPPRCDPATWTRHPREVIEAPASFFHPWRDAWGLAATRGEPWLGRPKSLLLPDAPDADAPAGTIEPDEESSDPAEESTPRR
ncbi:MAG: hypothetical protein R3326_01685 [Gemmatimonadota bacterium]|nr:hypothetical protein [Gemmatimonadota bacterium]